MTIDVIVNPVHPEGLRAIPRVQALCAQWGEHATVRSTSIVRPHGDPDPLADLTVVIGGDGTVRAVAGALLSHRDWVGTLAVVPTGAASIVALNCGVTSVRDGLDLLERVDTRSVTRLDVGWAVLHRSHQKHRAVELPFLVSAGIGHSGGTLQRTPPWAKSAGGALGYSVGAITRLRSPLVPVTLDLVSSDAESQDSVSWGPAPPGLPKTAGAELVPVWAVEFGNIAHVPYGVTVFPHGGLQTGTLAALAVTGTKVPGGAGRGGGLRQSVAPRAWCQIFRAGFRGGHEEVDALLLRSVSAGRVRSGTPLPAHVDGEAAGMVTGLDVRIVPSSLPVLVAMRSAARQTATIDRNSPENSTSLRR